MTTFTRGPVTARPLPAALLVIALAVGACGGATSTPSASASVPVAVLPSPTKAPTPTPTPTATATLAPTPTPTPDPTVEPTLTPATDVAAGLRIGSPYRLRSLTAALAKRLDPIIDGYAQAYDEYFTIAVREVRRSGAFEDVLLAFKLKPGLTSSVIGSWDDLIKGATMGGTLKSTTRMVAGVKVTYISTNTFGLAIFRLTGNRTYRNYLFEIVAPTHAKLAAVTAAFIKANN